ncbi:synaptic plasticity regulator PANTS [Anabrus simplex]|uniref:synaptic plasticity regulator PANTS n=1 Tax=Anabrus simplex TaxID=316456 RepID=UPI0035A3BA58
MVSSDKSKVMELPEEWLIRPCEMYNEEYKDCTSIKARFHQYFIFGEILDCSQWKKDYNNCEQCVSKGSIASCKAVIESEKQRRYNRLSAHYRNDVWEKRKEPPENWNVPLPEKMQKAYENSYLDYKSREMKEGKSRPSSERTLCVVS